MDKEKNEISSCKNIYDYIFVELLCILYISLHIKLLKSKIQFVRVLVKPLSHCTTILVTYLMMHIQQ